MWRYCNEFFSLQMSVRIGYFRNFFMSKQPLTLFSFRNCQTPPEYWVGTEGCQKRGVNFNRKEIVDRIVGYADYNLSNCWKCKGNDTIQSSTGRYFTVKSFYTIPIRASFSEPGSSVKGVVDNWEKNRREGFLGCAGFYWHCKHGWERE